MEEGREWFLQPAGLQGGKMAKERKKKERRGEWWGWDWEGGGGGGGGRESGLE